MAELLRSPWTMNTTLKIHYFDSLRRTEYKQNGPSGIIIDFIDLTGRLALPSQPPYNRKF